MGSQGAAASRRLEPVGLRGRHDQRQIQLAQPGQRVAVALEPRVPRVDEQDSAGRSGVPWPVRRRMPLRVEEPLGHPVEPAAGGRAAASVAIARQVDQQQFAPVAGELDAIDVEQPGRAGAPPARAIFRCARALINVDFPTLDRPTSAICGSCVTGSRLSSPTVVTNSAVWIFMAPSSLAGCRRATARWLQATGFGLQALPRRRRSPQGANMQPGPRLVSDGRAQWQGCLADGASELRRARPRRTAKGHHRPSESA